MEFSYQKKKEHEALAEQALRVKDYAKALYHTIQAADFTYNLAEASDGMIREAYLGNAHDLTDIAEELRRRMKAPATKVGADGSEDDSSGTGKCRLAERPEVRLDDVAGMEEAKRQIRLRLIEPLQNADEARQYGLKVGGGILLYGPPGTGKTFLAKAVAGELDLPFYAITSADVFGKYVGESENNIRDIFRDARQAPLSVIFIDELETIFRKRTGDIHETTQKVITVILQELDGVDDKKNPVLLLGATNAPWMIDEAFLRTGRFDVMTYVGLPDEAARQKILQGCFKDVALPVDGDVLDELARQADGYSGADLKGLAQAIKQTAYERKVGFTKELFTECLVACKPSINAETMKNIQEWEAANGLGRS